MPSRNRYGYAHGGSTLGGALIFEVGEIECAVDIWQPKDRVDHTPTPEEIDRDRKYNWPPRRYDYVPSNRLSIAIDTNSRFSSKQTWTETKTMPLQLRLADVMICFERWAVIDAEGREAERRAEIEKRAREAREDELARQAYVQHALAERLVADLNAWELAARLRRYLAEMAKRVEQIADPTERRATADWLEWCQDYSAKLDPLGKPVHQPEVGEPEYSDILEFRKRLGFHK